MKTKLQLAKADALAYLNGNRYAMKLPPIKRIAGHWWKLYGADYIARAMRASKITKEIAP